MIGKRRQPEPIRVRIGAIEVEVRSRYRRFREEYLDLYGAFRVPTVSDRAIHIDVEPRRVFPRERRRFQIFVNGRPRFAPYTHAEVLPYVEWSVNWEVPKVYPEFLQLHAASLERDGLGVILAGDSGHGKSTLATALVMRGWGYLCDEFALVRASNLNLIPYPRAICLKKPSYPIIEKLGWAPQAPPQFLKGAKGHVGFVNPLAHDPRSLGRPCLPRYILFPRYVPGAVPSLDPMSRAEAALELHRVCFNLFACDRVGTNVLAELVRGAECFRLTSGEIQATCDLLERSVGRSMAKRRSA